MSDIQTREILYYDADNIDQCYKFCDKRSIDCLPTIDDPGKLYRRDDATKESRSTASGSQR